MIARLRSRWFAVRASYWFWPALVAVIAFFGALGLVEVDRRWPADWLFALLPLHPTQAGGASTMLSVIAGSMIGVASTVFSITIAAVAYASGTYGPRLLANFMVDRGNQWSLAIFIGTFVFALTVLNGIVPGSGDQAEFVPQLALLVAFGLFMLSVGVLVYFLHHVPASIHINSVMEAIGGRLLGQIDELFPHPDAGDESRPHAPVEHAIAARGTGYVRVIDMARLDAMAERIGHDIGLAVRPGDFVHDGVPLARLDDAGAAATIAGELRDCFALGGSRAFEQDIDFSIDELVEIALRALSPAINDPFTAITAVHWLGAATGKLGTRDLRHWVLENRTAPASAIPLEDDFEHFVARGFGAARSFLASSRIVAIVTLDTLVEAARGIGDAGRIALLRHEGDRLMAQAELLLPGPDLAEVRTRHARFVRALT